MVRSLLVYGALVTSRGSASFLLLVCSCGLGEDIMDVTETVQVLKNQG